MKINYWLHPFSTSKTMRENKASFGRYSPDICHEKYFGQGLLAYEKKAEIPDYEHALREKLTEILGDMPEPFTPNAVEEYRKEREKFTEIRLVCEVEKDCFCPALLLLPKGKVKPPVVLCLQGHSQGMQISLGRPYRLQDIRKIEGDRDFGNTCIEHGYAALVPEQRCFGERRTSIIHGLPCLHTAHNALLIGRTLIGERVWDIRQMITYLQTREDVDGKKVGIMGNSGGGTASFYAGCMDERIQIVMPGCSVCTYYGSIGTKYHCACNYLPRAAKYFDMGDLATLIAPRKLVIVAGKKDPIFPLPEVKKAYSTIEKIYEEKGVSDSVRLVIGLGAHRFYNSGWDVFDRYAEELQWRK